MKTKLTEDIQEVDENQQDSDSNASSEEERLGVGAEAEGKVLKRIENEIHYYIDHEMAQLIPSDAHEPGISLPKFNMDQIEIHKIVDNLDDPKFWLQQALKEENNSKSHNSLEQANAYYRSGLKECPSSLKLIFNLARNSLILCKYKQA